VPQLALDRLNKLLGADDYGRLMGLDYGWATATTTAAAKHPLDGDEGLEGSGTERASAPAKHARDEDEDADGSGTEPGSAPAKRCHQRAV